MLGTNLLDQIHELFGKTLVVDSITAFPSEGDALASLVFEALSEQAREARAGRTRKFAKRMANRPGSSFPKALGLALTPMVDASQVFSVYLRQEDVFAAVRKLFPEHWLSGLTFPFIEDLVNGPPFDSYTRWLKEVGADWAGPCGPALAPQAVRVLQRADGQQAGALNQRAALPPLLSFGLSVDEHFEQATARLRSPMPTEQAPVLDRDLAFAASYTAENRTNFRALRRQHAVGAVRELKRRWAAVDSRLRRHQAPALRRVTAARDIGLIALLVVLFAWPDTALPPLDQGFRVGFLLPSLDERGSAEATQRQTYRLIPRCVITQSSGKQRIIDNADAGGQSETSRDSNKLVLCSALRPGQHAQAIVSRIPPEDLGAAKESDSLESGGEDWPDAYRHCPMHEDESLACLVVWWHHEWNAPALPNLCWLAVWSALAVTSFNRYSRFAEASSRRIALTVASSYFDDFNVVDWASSKGSGQWAVGAINGLLGTAFVDEKRQPMSLQGTFLGLDHDLSCALSEGYVTFWARDRLFCKMEDLIRQAEGSNTLRSGLASKMFGLMNFLEQGMY